MQFVSRSFGDGSDVGREFHLNRVSVVGTTGSGKTTFATRLGGVLGIPHIELDALNWSGNWTAVPPEVFRARVREAVNSNQWVIDGNYSAVRDLVWGRAEMIVWLDYPLRVILTRLVRRTARRIAFDEPCCNGNRESLRMALSRDSIIWWALSTYRRRRREYPGLLTAHQARGAQVVRLRSTKEAEEWMATHRRI